MTQAVRAPASSPGSQPEQPPNTRERIERARALVIAQFGAAVLVSAESSESNSTLTSNQMNARSFRLADTTAAWLRSGFAVSSALLIVESI